MKNNAKIMDTQLNMWCKHVLDREVRNVWKNVVSTRKRHNVRLFLHQI